MEERTKGGARLCDSLLVLVGRKLGGTILETIQDKNGQSDICSDTGFLTCKRHGHRAAFRSSRPLPGTSFLANGDMLLCLCPTRAYAMVGSIRPGNATSQQLAELITGVEESGVKRSKSRSRNSGFDLPLQLLSFSTARLFDCRTLDFLLTSAAT